MLDAETHGRIHAVAYPTSGGRSGRRPTTPPLVGPDVTKKIPVAVLPDGSIAPGTLAKAAGNQTAQDEASAMIAVFLPADVAKQLAVDHPDAQAAENMHMTVLPVLADLSEDQMAALHTAVAEFAAQEAPLDAHLAGIGKFLGKPGPGSVAKAMDPTKPSEGGAHVVFAPVDAPGLTEMRHRLQEHLAAASLDIGDSDHGFTPHVTLGRVPGDSAAGDTGPFAMLQEPVPFQVAHLAVAQGTDRKVYPFHQGIASDTSDVPVAKAAGGGGDSGIPSNTDSAPASPQAAVPSPASFTRLVPICKADEEQRIVYGMVLIPDLEDAHGDIVSREEIEKAAHEFMAEFREQGVQHRASALPDIRVVESYIAPTTMVIKSMDGRSTTVPEGTWVMGTYVGNDEVWAEVKAGVRTNFSIQGSAIRREAA